MDTIPCPGCRTELNLSDTSCPICLRGRTKQEILRGYTAAREAAARRKRRPFVILGTLLAVGAAGTLVYELRGPLAEGWEWSRATASRKLTAWTDKITNPDVVYSGSDAKTTGRVPPPAPAPVRAPAATPAPAPVRPAPTPARVVAPPPPDETMKAAVPKPAPQKPAAPPPQAMPTAQPGFFVLYGTAFDLKTLKPVPKAVLTFSNGSAFGGTALADDYGRYAVDLARPQSYRPEDGYDIVCQVNGYARAVQHETDIPYLTLSRDDRLEMIRLARSNDVHSSPIFDIEGQNKRRLDVFLSPLADSP